MKFLIEFFIKRPLIVNLISVLLVLAGFFSLTSLQREIFPKAEFDMVIISTSYPGTSSEDIEKLITIEIEREVKSVQGIKKLHGISNEGVSIVYIEIDPDYETDDVYGELKDKVDLIDDLPDDATTPYISSLSNKDKGVIKIGLTGGNDYIELRQTALDLRDALEVYKPISKIDLGGYQKDEISINVSPEKLNLYELTLGQVSNAIKERNLSLSAGKIETLSEDIIIRTVAEYETPEDIENVVIRSNSSGASVKVKDVATVLRAPKDSSVEERANGKKAIFLDVSIKEKADIINSTDKIKDITKKFFEKRGDSVDHLFADDLSFWVKRRLGVVKDSGLLGMVLVLVCLTLFLNFRTSLITAFGAPIAFLAAFVMMAYLSMSINVISMLALILVLGMLVDDAIIVAEQYYQKLEAGMAPLPAAKEAAFETIQPVVATILTTMIAFGSMFFMGGIMGKFLWPIPAVVMICLAASLIECFFILPSHLAEFGKLGKKKERRWYDPIKDFYRKTLVLFLKFPLVVVILSILIFVGSLTMAIKTMRFELFPGDDVTLVRVGVKGKVGTPRAITDEALKNIENVILSSLTKKELDQMRAKSGSMMGSHGNKRGSHYASVLLYLTDPKDRAMTTDEIIKLVISKSEKITDGFEITAEKMAGGPPKGKDAEIKLTGDNMKNIYAMAKVVNKKLKEQVGVTSTEIDYEAGKEQIVVRVDDAEAKRLGLTTGGIAMELRRAYGEDSLTEIRETEEDIEVIVRLDKVSKSDPKKIESLFILNNQGRRIPITKVVKFERSKGAFVIRRLDSKRIISVSGSLNKAKTNSIELAKMMEKPLEDISKQFPDVKYEFGGENADTKESMDGLLKAGTLAMLSIFFVLVVMFSSFLQPFIIMTAIPGGLVGVIWAFKIMDLSLGFMALMGVVALIGVVVNDSIVLVNFINLKIKETKEVASSILEASVSRFRPVLLTSFTTVAGLLPMAYQKGGDPFIKPMALSFAWGLLLATFVTLVFIPCNYYVFYKAKEFVTRKILKKSV